jgi:hypothetical protein
MQNGKAMQWLYEPSAADCLHNQAVFVLSALLELVLFICWTSHLSGCCGLNDGKALLCSLVSTVGGFDVPDVRFERIASASNTHLCEVTARVFSLGQAFESQ